LAALRAEVDVRPVRERRPARRKAFLRAVPWKRLGLGAVLALLVGMLGAGLLFAGSAGRIAAGVTVSGLNVGGKTPAEAAALLEARAAELAEVPVVFTVGDERFPLRPADLEARVDWNAVAAEARAEGDWPLPFRGLKRIALRLVGADVAAHLRQPGLQRPGHARVQADDRAERGAAHRQLLEDAHVHAEHDYAVMRRAPGESWAPTRNAAI